MRALRIFAATAAVAGLLGACSDGSEAINGAGGGSSNTPPPTGGSGDQPGGATGPTAGTGATPGVGGSGNAPATGGADAVGGGSGSVAGSAPQGGSATGGSGTGTGGMVGMAGTGTGGGGSDTNPGPFKILVLTTSLQFPHDSIGICSLMVGIEGAFDFLENGKHHTGTSLRQEVEVTQNQGKQPANLGATPDGMMPMGTKPGSQWTAVLAKHDLSDFTDENLKNYAAVFSCNPTGPVFSANSNVKDDKAIHMAALQKYVENGGAFAGVHSASDFENSNGFPWFTNTLMGAYFVTHDNDGTQGTVQTVSMYKDHPVMRGVPATWSTSDEWYKMNRDVGAQPGFQVLAKLSDERPAIWTKTVGQGRMFYTIRGHNRNVYKEPNFRTLVLNGILWATKRLE